MTSSTFLTPQASPSRQQQFQRHDCCLLDSQALCRIQSGFVRTLSWDEEGRLTSLGIWGPGELISTGFSPISPIQLDFLQPTCLCEVSHSTVNLRDFLINRLLRTEELMCILHVQDTLCRLRKCFSWLAQRFGQPTAAGMLLPLYLTHQELGELINSTRVTVTKLMSQLKQQGEIIQLRGEQTLLSSTAMSLKML